MSLENYGKEMRTGLLLSDATYVKKYIGGGTYFQIAGSIKFKPFIFHIHKVLYELGFVNMPEPTIKKTIVKGTEYFYYSFSTKSIKIWNSEKALWYFKGKKVVPLNIGELLTPVALAFWIMGDGGRTQNGLHLATHSFTKKEVNLLIKALKSNFHLNCSVHSQNRVYIYTKSMPKLREIVTPFMLPEMLYKIEIKRFTYIKA